MYRVFLSLCEDQTHLETIQQVFKHSVYTCRGCRAARNLPLPPAGGFWAATPRCQMARKGGFRAATPGCHVARNPQVSRTPKGIISSSKQEKARHRPKQPENIPEINVGSADKSGPVPSLTLKQNWANLGSRNLPPHPLPMPPRFGTCPPRCESGTCAAALPACSGRLRSNAS